MVWLPGNHEPYKALLQSWIQMTVLQAVFKCIKLHQNIRNVNMLWVFQCACMHVGNDYKWLIEQLIQNTRQSSWLVSCEATYTYHRVGSHWVGRLLQTNLCDFFTMVSHKTAAFSLSSASAHHFFSRFEVSWGDSNHSLKNYGFLCNAIFSSCVNMCTNHLAMKCNYYAWIRNTVGEQGVFEESLVWSVILQPILHRKPVRTELLLCDRWQTSAQACICC